MRNTDRNILIIAVIAIFVIVLGSRIPFLDEGYGVEEDSWGLVVNCQEMQDSARYVASRLPGHPVQEYVYYSVYPSGPFTFNFFSAFFAACASVAFGLILLHFKIRNWFAGAIALSFVPVVYISSTYTIDYTWTLAFILWSFYFLLKEKIWVSGIFLGLAIGCRITAGAMIIPWTVMIFQNHRFSFFKKLTPLYVSAATVAVLSFLPVYLAYGKDFFQYYDQFPYPPASKIFYKGTLGVWGFAGMISLLFMIISVFRNKPVTDKKEKQLAIISLIVITLFVIAYFRLPQKSGYLIPLVPFVILLAAVYAKKFFPWFTFGLIISPFLFSINLTDGFRGAESSSLALKATVSGQEIFFDPLSGPIFSEDSKRKRKKEYTDQVLKVMDTVKTPSLFICGWWYNEIRVKSMDRDSNPNVTLMFYSPDPVMEEKFSKGEQIYFLPEQDVYNDLMFKINTTNTFAKPLIIK